MPLFSRKKKKETTESSSVTTVNNNKSVSTNGQQMVHSTSFTREERLVTQRTEIRTTAIEHAFNSEPSLLGNTTSNISKSFLPQLSLPSSTPPRKDSLPAFWRPNTNKLSSYKSSLSTDATPFSRGGTYSSTPHRTAFSGNPMSTSGVNRSYGSNSGSTPALRSYNTSTVSSINSASLPPTPMLRNNLPKVYVAETSDYLKKPLTINVKKSTKFYDDENLKIPSYRTRSKSRGMLLLVNNIKFANDKERKGAELDEVNVVKLFTQMGFEICKHRDLTKKDMEKKITSFSQKNSLKKVDIGTVIIMSHGTGKERSDSTEVVCTDGQLLETTWIIDQFNGDSCPYLSGKPKIFIFQCCRGRNLQTDHGGGITREVVPRQVSDMLVAYATIPGFVSYRDPEEGTWYIQAICEVFMEHAHDTDVENLLKMVDHKIASLVYRNSKQTSSFENRGFKTCYFHPQLYRST